MFRVTNFFATFLHTQRIISKSITPAKCQTNGILTSAFTSRIHPWLQNVLLTIKSKYRLNATIVRRMDIIRRNVLSPRASLVARTAIAQHTILPAAPITQKQVQKLIKLILILIRKSPN